MGSPVVYGFSPGEPISTKFGIPSIPSFSFGPLVRRKFGEDELQSPSILRLHNTAKGGALNNPVPILTWRCRIASSESQNMMVMNSISSPKFRRSRWLLLYPATLPIPGRSSGLSLASYASACSGFVQPCQIFAIMHSHLDP